MRPNDEFSLHSYLDISTRGLRTENFANFNDRIRGKIMH